MKKWIVVVFVFGITSNYSLAQNYSPEDQTKLDSLTAIVNSSANDTIKTITYHRIGVFHNIKGNYSAAIVAWNKKLSLDKQLGNKSGIAGSLTNIGAVYKNQGEIEKTLDYFLKSLKIYEEISNKIGIAGSLANIGTVYNFQGEIEMALEYFHKSLKISEELGSKSGIANCLNNLAVVYVNQGEIEKSLEYYHKSVKLFEESDNKIGMASCLNNIGSLYHTQGEIGKALEYYRKSLKIKQKIGNKSGIAYSLNSIGIVYKDQGDIERALEYYLKSLKILEQLGNKSGIAGRLHNIGIVYYDQGEPKKALEYYLKGLNIHEQLGDKSRIASSLNSIGIFYKAQGELVKALEYHHKSLKIKEELGNKSEIAVSLTNIGVAYNAQGEPVKALEYYRKSVKIDEQIGNKSGMAMSLTNIGNIYYEQGDIKKAQAVGEHSLIISKEIGYPDLVRHASNLLTTVYKKTKQYKQALEMYELYILMRDSINNESTQKAVIKQNMQYEYEKQYLADSLETSKELALKDIEISKQQAEAKAERTTKYSLYGGLALVLIIALVLAHSVKQKKKANKEISQQKQEVENSKLHIEQLHKEVTDSIHYAAHIQNAILTSDAYWQRMLANHFIFFKPRDIVSGDFYWAYECPRGRVSSASASGEARGKTTTGKGMGGKKIWIAADCTGHGVPGGFMSMLGNTFLNEIVIEQGEEDASEILNKLRDHIIKALANDVGTDEGLEMKDGLDLALCVLHSDNTLEYSGANNPLWVLSSRKEVSAAARVTPNESEDKFIHEIKADKQPIGKYSQMTAFTSHFVKLETGDQVYTFSDGFQDQFGGPKLKKYMSKRLKKFLFSIADESMEKQKELMLVEFEEWRKDTEQVDDVCIIGVKI